MSYASVLGAVQRAMTAALPEFTTIDQAERLVPNLTPDQCPALLLLEVPGSSRPLSGGFPGGWLEEQWDLECHVFAFFADTSDPDSFRDLLNRVQAVFPANHFFNQQQADTNSPVLSRVLHAGLVRQTRITAWQGSAIGGVMREGYVKARVVEETQG